jgi:hypothetical protein
LRPGFLRNTGVKKHTTRTKFRPAGHSLLTISWTANFAYSQFANEKS